MNASLPVREATADDVGALLDLVHSAYRGESSRAGWTTEADLLDGSRTTTDLLAADLTSPRTTFLVAGDMAGCAAVTVTGDLASFGTFAVRPDNQAIGVGSLLLSAAEDHARARGTARMEMTVIAQRAELIAWYKRRGYAATGETRPFPYGDQRYGRPLRDDLVFTVLVKPLGVPG